MTAEVEQAEQTVRVTQLWPPGLKEEVRELVGARGVTSFTIEAVRALVASRKGAEPPAPEPVTEEREEGSSPPAPQSPQEEPAEPQEEERRAPTPLPANVLDRVRPTDRSAEESGEPTATTRGDAVKVDAPPTLGVAAKFNRSGKTFDDLLKRADELNIKRASDILPPNVAAAAVAVAKEEAIKELEALPEVRMPADTKPFEEALEERESKYRSSNAPAPEPAPQAWSEPEAQTDYELSSDSVAEPTPEPVPDLPQPSYTRDLDEYSVDF